MKRNEWKVKSYIYGAIASYVENQKELIDFFKNLYEALKNVEMDEFKNIIADKVVEYAKSKEEI